jgi:GT2 family glycosyltransferase
VSLISLITLTYNKLAVTRRCLPSLLQSSARNWELIVLENGSTDGTLEWLKAFQREAESAGIRITILPQANNIGCSTGRNVAAAAASGDRLVFLDNDVAVRSRDWLQGLGRVFEEDSTAAIVCPKLVYPFPPYAIQCAGGAVTPAGRVVFMGRGEANGEPRFNRRCEVQWAISACWMVRADVFRESGGFDEAFNPVQFEDTDLCYRIRSRGHRVVYEPAVEMYHYESTTTAGTAGLPNTALVVRHGLLFRNRWLSVIEKENGPAESEAAWRKIAIPPLESIPEPPVV